MTEKIIAMVDAAAASRLQLGYPWIFKEQILRWQGTPEPGDLVAIQNPAGDIVGYAYANLRSKIALRLLYSPKAATRNSGWPDEAVELARKLDRARSARLPQQYASNAWRLVWSEADGLPGVIVDVYDQWLVAQFLTAGADRRRALILDWLVSRIKPKGIYERSHGFGLQAEGLPERSGWLWQAAGVEPQTECVVQEGSLKFYVEMAAGHKTGFYLDQRAARRRILARAWQGKVLDGCTYTGGFALAAAKAGAREVIALDISSAALAQLQRNAELNGLTSAIRPLRENIFHYLTAAVTRGEKYQLVILDPPPFARHRANVARALAGYRELHRRAAQLLEPNGWLMSCTCSHHISRQDFREIALQGFRNAGKNLHVQALFGPDGDHPEKSQIPESRYLTCLWGQLRS